MPRPAALPLSAPPPEPAQFGLPALDPEGRPWSPLTVLILQQRRGDITLDAMMAGAMPYVRRVARFAGAARRLGEEVDEIAQELAILLYTDLHRQFDPARADAMSMLTTYARSVARTEKRRADRRPLPMEEPAEVWSPGTADSADLVTGMAGTGAARDGDDDPFFARLDQTMAQHRIATALGFPAVQPADIVSRNRKEGVRTRRDGSGRDAATMSPPKTTRRSRPNTTRGVTAVLPEVPITLGRVEVIERHGVPRLAAAAKLPGERRNRDLQSSSKKPVTPQQRLLRDTRRLLGYTAAQFAEMLHIGLPRLSSYEYGVTSIVPEDIMRRVEQLARRESGKAAALAAFKGKLIGTIVSEWEQKLRPYVRAALPREERAPASEPLTLKQLALELQINVITLKRWWHSHTRPPETRIAAVDEQVKARLALHKARALKRRLAHGESA